jgi:hypothetical protein
MDLRKTQASIFNDFEVNIATSICDPQGLANIKHILISFRIKHITKLESDGRNFFTIELMDRSKPPSLTRLEFQRIRFCRSVHFWLCG